MLRGRLLDPERPLLPYLSTQATAQDMDSLRRALGEEQLSYFGFSYGSELGATWATRFPETVRAAVLDGAANPNDGWEAGRDRPGRRPRARAS